MDTQLVLDTILKMAKRNFKKSLELTVRLMDTQLFLDTILKMANRNLKNHSN